ncbi:MAG TPA: hypothetical protein VGL27_09800 [Negativicutes bacterium]|jgi:hypothetical protein
MMNKIIISMLLVVTLLFGGCGQPVALPPVAGLVPLTADKLLAWGVPERLNQQGQGNWYQASQLADSPVLELAAGGSGQLEYFMEESADRFSFAQSSLQFLSTQGTGRIQLSALDGQGQVLGKVGWVFTGTVPPTTAKEHWLDVRYTANYLGGWLDAGYNCKEMLDTYLPEQSLAAAQKYRLSVVVGEGQHALIRKFTSGQEKDRAVKLTPLQAQYAVQLGDIVVLEADVENISSQVVNDTVISLLEPAGYGLVTMQDSVQKLDTLKPGEKRRLTWQVKAQRPDAVNFTKPWLAKFTVNSDQPVAQVEIAVADPRPGRIFYVMTEDLEPIDSAGYPVAWGNADGWLSPQEYMTQMVYKSEKLNTIAEQHGAKWTHYIAWPAVKAAEWAAGKSTTGQWTKVVSAISQSVVSQSAHGHEYGVHLHSDYDPYLPGNVLSYNQTVDGLWANHLKHGWAHSVLTEGDFSDYASRAGMLYAYQRILDELSSGSPQGQHLTARVGSFDFGSGAVDEAMSTSVYKKVGLWGSSDADGNVAGITAGDYGQALYFAAADDINVPANDIGKVGLVEFRPTPREYISYDNQSAAVMNGKADQGMAYFTTGNTIIKPGVHAITGFTHAMFVMGMGDWQSTEGGQFAAIDEHLFYLEQNYVKQGLLTFATASELVREYLDYYTPKPIAVYGQRLTQGMGSTEYAVHILGKDIPFDNRHSHQISIKYPLYLRDSAYRISVLKDGKTIYTTWGLPTPFNDIRFPADDSSATYTLKIYHNKIVYKIMEQFYAIKTIITEKLKKI